LIQEKAAEEMPNQEERRSKRIEWFIVSKVADKLSQEEWDKRHVDDDMIMNGEKSSLGRMMLDYRQTGKNLGGCW